jgi:outer membrane protein assembly factor BamB
VSFGSHGIYCYTFDGELQWHRRLGQMRTRHGWGEGASPALLHGRALLVNWDHEGQSFLVALDAATGEVKWQVDREEPTSWSTPLIVPGNDRTQVIVSASNRVRSYDVENGQLIWQCGGLTTNVIASPVATSDAAICMSWYGQASVLALPLDASGDLTDSDRLAWRYDQMAPYCPSPLLLDNRLYFLHANSNVFACLDAANGKPLAPPRRLAKIDGDVYASPVAAGGRIYFVNREGTKGVYQAGPELELLSTNELNEPVDASPAIAGPQMFLRGHKHLFCLQEEPQ